MHIRVSHDVVMENVKQHLILFGSGSIKKLIGSVPVVAKGYHVRARLRDIKKGHIKNNRALDPTQTRAQLTHCCTRDTIPLLHDLLNLGDVYPSGDGCLKGRLMRKTTGPSYRG